MTGRHALALAIAVAAGVGVESQGPANAADEPPRVTGLSNLMDYGATGSTLAVPLLYGIGTSAANLALAQFPPAAAPLTHQVFLMEGSGPQLFTAAQPGTAALIAAGRNGAAALAPFNPQANAFLTAVSTGARSTASALHPVLQPADLTVNQFADYLDSLQHK